MLLKKHHILYITSYCHFRVISYITISLTLNCKALHYFCSTFTFTRIIKKKKKNLKHFVPSDGAVFTVFTRRMLTAPSCGVHDIVSQIFPQAPRSRLETRLIMFSETTEPTDTTLCGLFTLYCSSITLANYL